MVSEDRPRSRALCAQTETLRLHRVCDGGTQAAAHAADEYTHQVGVSRRFNCELRPYVMTCVNIGVAVHGGVVKMTRALVVPFLVNTVDLEDGEHLFPEIQETGQKQ